MRQLAAPRLLLLLISLFVYRQVEAAPGSFDQSAKRLAPNLSGAASCSDDAGLYRALVFRQGFEHLSSEVYLQWLDWDETGQRVSKSVLVTELGNMLLSETPVVVPGEKCSMRIDTTHAYSNESASYLLEPRSSGKYSIKQVKKTRDATK